MHSPHTLVSHVAIRCPVAIVDAKVVTLASSSLLPPKAPKGMGWRVSVFLDRWLLFLHMLAIFFC